MSIFTCAMSFVNHLVCYIGTRLAKMLVRKIKLVENPGNANIYRSDAAAGHTRDFSAIAYHCYLGQHESLFTSTIHYSILRYPVLGSSSSTSHGSCDRGCLRG